jgi:uncharacterized membrane protein YdjX (TVP38/TMEM64 family)
MRAFKNPWLKLLLVVLILAGAYFALRSANVDFSAFTKEQLKEKIHGFGIWGPIIYIVIYVLRPLILFPAGILSASAGFIWGLKGFFYLQIAANISSTVEFFISRYFGRGAISRLIKGKMLNLDEKIAKHGFLTVLLIRLIPNVAWDIQNLSLGLTKVKFRDYFIATLIGIIPGSFAFVYFGASIIEVLTNPRNFWMLVVATLIFVGIYFLQGLLRKRHGDKIKAEAYTEPGSDR